MGNHNTISKLPAEQGRTERITWKHLCQLEPRLLDLYERARAVKDDKRKPWFCANRVWYSTFKPRLLNLVGWRRRDHPILGTSTAYDIAYRKCYYVLPACRNCCCLDPDAIRALRMGANA